MNQPSVSVVVCAHTRARAAFLLEALSSLERQSRLPDEVIVVVDHNHPLLRFVRRRAGAVTAVANAGSRGLATARNTGVNAAGGDVVAFLDDDAVAAPDWIEQLTSAYRDPAVLGVGGAIEPVFEDRAPGWLPEEFHWVVGCTYRGLPAAPSPVRNLIGCNMSFRREAIVRAGGFACELGRTGSDCQGCEETELCIRLGRQTPAGVLLYDPAARVRHHVPRERATVGYFLSRCHAEGLSKAQVASRCGRHRGLASERAYVRATLPAGVRRGVLDFVRGERAGLARAGSIVLGLGATSLGFFRGQARGAWA